MSTKSSDATRDQGVVEQASSAVQSAASTTQAKAGELTDKGRSRLSEQLDSRTTEVGSQAQQMARALRQSADEMDGNGATGRFGHQVADQVERLGRYLEEKRGDEILQDVENLARRRPWMIAGLGLLAGFAASRFVKASSEQRYGSRQPSTSGHHVALGAGSSEPSWDREAALDPGAPLDTDVPLARDPGEARVSP